MSMSTLNDGALFANRYRVVRCIAQGGMGAVYEVVHLETDRHRALKVMLPHLVQSEELRERFRREARIAAQIDSAYIVDVFDAGIDDATGMPFLVMELLRGEELGKRLKRVGRFGFEEALGYLWQTALALDKTHKANIVHRDLKPENLFLSLQDDEPPRIKVLDFGIAKFIAEGGTQANATRSLGTPLYMAPEQFQAGSRVTPATDLFSLGMMAYTLLVGSPYWRDEERSSGNVFSFAAIAMRGPEEPASARALRCGVTLPPAFDAWFRQATARAAEERFFTATAAIAGLAQALGLAAPGQPAQAAASAVGRAEPDSSSAALGANGGTLVLGAGTTGGASGGFGSSSQPGGAGAVATDGERGSRKRGRALLFGSSLAACAALIGVLVFFEAKLSAPAPSAFVPAAAAVAPSSAASPSAAPSPAPVDAPAALEKPVDVPDAGVDAGVDAAAPWSPKKALGKAPLPSPQPTNAGQWSRD